jgi:hypothetical protein
MRNDKKIFRNRMTYQKDTTFRQKSVLKIYHLLDRKTPNRESIVHSEIGRSPDL